MKQLFLTILALSLLLQFTTAQYDWADALEKSLIFYEAQRSGRLPANNRVPWRHDSALDDAFPQGYYDAGDHVKFGFPLASMTTIMSWGALTFEQGYAMAGQTAYLKEAMKWATDYMLSTHTAKYELWGQVGDGHLDHDAWCRPEDMTMARPAFKIDQNAPGSDLAGETAAAFAASSMVYRNMGDAALADTMLSHARDLFEFADLYRAKYTDSIPEASDFYNSWSGFGDELAWSAIWMYKATGEPIFLSKAEQFYDEFGISYTPSVLNWDDKIVGVQFLLYEATGNARYLQNVNNYVDFLLNGARRTPLGLVYLDDWGTLRLSANAAFWCLQVASAGIRESDCRNFAQEQIDYIMGSTGRSFIVGWGVNPPTHAHHRAASCPITGICTYDNYLLPDPNPNVIVGALVGGPDVTDYFTDSRQDWEETEVGLDYNAGYQGVLAAMVMGNGK